MVWDSQSSSQGVQWRRPWNSAGAQTTDLEGPTQGGREDASVRIARRQHLGLLLPRTAARTPNKLALVWRDRRETYAELNVAVNRTANAIRARGLRQGDKVALFSHNCREYLTVYLALAKLGAISVPVNFMLSAAELAFILGHARVRGIVVASRAGRRARRASHRAVVVGARLF
jgi:fatty-acyl-CoA synthase